MNYWRNGFSWRAASTSMLGVVLGLALPLKAAPPAEGDRELCRTLVRTLDDSADLVVERCWAIRFTADRTEIRVDGTQSSVTVDAPATLAPLARLEEDRVEDSMFPLVLGADRLVKGHDNISAGATLEEARDAAAAIIAQIEPDPVAADTMRGFVAQVTSASAQFLGRIPRDLFYPMVKYRPETISVTLPDGSTGRVTIDQSAIADSSTGLLKSVRRSIVTEAGGTTSKSVETWVLKPAK